MSKLLILTVAQIAALTTPVAIAAATTTATPTQISSLALNKQSQPTQVVQTGNGKQLLQSGLNLYQQEKFSEAVQVLQRAAVAFQNQNDFLNQALALNYAALAYQQIGQLAQANKAITDSLDLLQKRRINSKEYTSVLAQALNTQGQIQLAQGQSEKALASWETATALYKKNQDSAGEIGSKINQAQALQALGLYRRARITLDQVNRQLQQQSDPRLKATGLLSLGNALRVVGVLDQKEKDSKIQETRKETGSLQALNQSLAEAKKLPDAPELKAEIHLSLGNTLRALKKSAEAIKQYQQAAELSVSPMTRLVAQMNLLRLAIETRETATYQTLIPQIQSQLATIQPSRKSIYARINFAQSLACLNNVSGTRGMAVNLVCPKEADSQNVTNPSDAVETTQKNLVQNVTINQSEIAQIVGTAVEQARSLGDKRGEAYALGTLGGLYEQTQQWDFAQKLTQQALAVAESIDARDISYRWHWQLGRILRERGQDKAAIASYTKAVDILKSLRTDLVAINRDVQFSFQEGVEPIYRELVSLLLQSPEGKQSNQQTLDRARNVIESLQLAELDNFFRRACIDAQPVAIDEVDKTAAVIYPVILDDRLEIIVSMPSKSGNQNAAAAKQTEKQKSNQIFRRHTVSLDRQKIEETTDQLRQLLENRTTPEYLPVSQQMYKWIIEPFSKELKDYDIKTLVFVLDGPMRSIPMAALHDGEQFLVENYDIALTPGLQLLNPRPLARTELRTLAGGLSESRENFPPLPNVEDELMKIESTVPTSKVLLNNQFTTAAIENAVKSLSAPIVHLATHGQFSSEAEDTFILTYNGRVNVNELNELLETRETNRRGAIELLVLSACTTAAGDNRAALGIAGVAVRSGARSTLASLWTVDDEATSLIMGKFYEQLKESKMTKAQAFKNAQLSLLKDKNNLYDHPYYWAPYVLVGNWL